MIVAVDTGGTKTLVTVFSRDGISGEQIKFPTPKDTDEYITTLRNTLKNRYGGQRVEAIIVAVPGIVKDGVAIECINLGWKNFDVGKKLKGVLGPAPVFVENDANLAGLGETRSRDPMPKTALYVTVSTGIGTGFIVNGAIDPGLRSSEGGHMLVEYQGKVQIWESFASGRAIYTTYGKYARDIHDKKTWDEIADRISRGFLAAIPLIQPDAIIIGGSMGTYFDSYAQQLEALLKDQLTSPIVCPPLLAARHPEEAVVYGCYYYGIDKLSTK